jgi:hypothetical protein
MEDFDKNCPTSFLSENVGKLRKGVFFQFPSIARGTLKFPVVFYSPAHAGIFTKS